MKNRPWQARQGDVLLVAVSSIPAEAKAHVRPADQGRVILAYGEVTGHAHALDASTVTAYGPSDDAFWLAVEKDGAVVTHEEHSAIVIPSDVKFLAVRRQKQYTPSRIENVTD
jgi:hypothetical protein